MPRTKSLQHYPERYQEIVRECALQGKTVRVPLDTLKQAMSLRGHWYAFVGSLKVHVRELEREPLRARGSQDLIELAAQVSTVMVQIASEPPAVIFQSREHSWQANALRRATVTAGDSKPSVDLDDMQQRLMKIQQEKEDGKDG